MIAKYDIVKNTFERLVSDHEDLEDGCMYIAHEIQGPGEYGVMKIEGILDFPVVFTTE